MQPRSYAAASAGLHSATLSRALVHHPLRTWMTKTTTTHAPEREVQTDRGTHTWDLPPGRASRYRIDRGLGFSHEAVEVEMNADENEYRGTDNESVRLASMAVAEVDDE